MRTYDVNKPQLSPKLKHLIYNANDCLVTLEVWNKQQPLLDETGQRQSYERSMGEMAAGMVMSQHGMLVNNEMKLKVQAELDSRIKAFEAMLAEFSHARFLRPMNPRSHKDKKEMLYGWTPPKPGNTVMPKYEGPNLGLKRIYSFKKGVKSCTTDRGALEQLAQRNAEAALFANLLNVISDLSKQKEVFDAKLCDDGRMRCAYNVAGTDTYRWSSNDTPEYRGRNLQNISEPLRDMFVADDGKVMIYADYEQAESRIVAYRTGDPAYIAACEGGDLHTTVCKMVWPDRKWPHDNGKADKEMAEEKFYRHYSYRDMSKRGGHGTNYYGKPPTMAKQLNVETAVMRSFQENYFGAFGGIPDWHHEVHHILLANKPIVTAFGRRREFFGRSTADETLRAAIAYEPQSTLSSLVKQAHVNAYREQYSRDWARQCGFALVHDLHDAMLVQCYTEAEAEVRTHLDRMMYIPVDYPSGTMVIPTEAKSGRNWGYYDYKNPERNPEGMR